MSQLESTNCTVHDAYLGLSAEKNNCNNDNCLGASGQAGILNSLLCAVSLVSLAGCQLSKVSNSYMQATVQSFDYDFKTLGMPFKLVL